MTTFLPLLYKYRDNASVVCTHAHCFLYKCVQFADFEGGRSNPNAQTVEGATMKNLPESGGDSGRNGDYLGEGLRIH